VMPVLEFWPGEHLITAHWGVKQWQAQVRRRLKETEQRADAAA
jgi:hypothetical protein